MSLLMTMINLVLLLSIFVLFVEVFSEEAALRPNVVNVGAIFSFDTTNGKVAKFAMKAAEDDINSDPSILGGRKLSVALHDSNYSSFLGFIGGILFPISSYFQLFSSVYVRLISFISRH